MFFSAVTKITKVGIAIPFIVTGFTVVPNAIKVGYLAVNLSEPVFVSQYRISTFKPEDYVQEIRALLLQKDPAAAHDILVLAKEEAISITPELEAEVSEANKFHVLKAIRDCGGGFIFGKGNSTTELACSIGGDLTPVGDPRDLAIELSKYPDYDPWTVGFAVTGIAFTAATYLGGTGAPAKAGLSILKFAKKSGKISIRFMEDLGSLLVRSIDHKAVEDLAVSAKRFDLDKIAANAGKLIDPKALNELSSVSATIQKIGGQNGYRVALNTLGASDSIADVKKWSAVSEKFGKKFPGTLKMLKSSGKLVINISEVIGKLLFWLFAGLAWFAAMIISSVISIWTLFSISNSLQSRSYEKNLETR